MGVAGLIQDQLAKACPNRRTSMHRTRLRPRFVVPTLQSPPAALAHVVSRDLSTPVEIGRQPWHTTITSSFYRGELTLQSGNTWCGMLMPGGSNEKDNCSSWDAAINHRRRGIWRHNLDVATRTRHVPASAGLGKPASPLSPLAPGGNSGRGFLHSKYAMIQGHSRGATPSFFDSSALHRYIDR
jgi:hypothetical protein